MHTINGTIIDQLGYHRDGWNGNEYFTADSIADALERIVCDTAYGMRSVLAVHLAGRGWVDYDPLYHVIEDDCVEPRAQLTARARSYQASIIEEPHVRLPAYLDMYRGQCRAAALSGQAHTAALYRAKAHAVKQLLRKQREQTAQLTTAQ